MRATREEAVRWGGAWRQREGMGRGDDMAAWPTKLPGTARPKLGRAWAEASRADTAQPTRWAVPSQSTGVIHGPILLGSCRAGLKA
ncbi:hypothetical protein [Oryza sativa Japonica Group]|uniref:Uncharacterized protein n=1 Tax=Oryza sativa subsp. japonica TaxID=39947 RepID=Q8LQ86_ORYSJ|nr:hypothetical protein [Oryza sativa Japonica Group]